MVYPGGRLAGTINSTQHSLGTSIFDYIEKQHTRSPIFYNFMYTADLEYPVLRPQSSLPSLHIWKYYIHEDLALGPSYDLEVVAMESQQEEENAAADGIIPNVRKVVTMGYV